MITGWTKPTDRACLVIAGPDAVRYLNGQITNDIKGDLSGKVVTACVCTMKGKVEGVVRVTAGEQENSLLIEVEAAQAEAIFNRLDRYLIADDCELTEAETAPPLIHLITDKKVTGDAREHWRYGRKGFDIYSEFDLTGFDEISKESLLQQKILHGIPQYGFEITGDEFPAGLGLDKWAVDFHKGCYLGQEIVSRIESAGKIPKRQRLFSTENTFEKDTPLTNAAGKEVATVVRDSVPHPEEPGHFLTSLFAKEVFEDSEFTEIPIQFPPKL